MKKYLLLLWMPLLSVHANAQTREVSGTSLLNGAAGNDSFITEINIPGGEYDMGDHFGFVDPGHPSDETPVHKVRVDTFYIGQTETTNLQYLLFLNDQFKAGKIEVRNNKVYLKGDTNLLCYTHDYEAWYSIQFNGSVFFIADFRAGHPMTGVMWKGAIAYCNWLSTRNGLQECYDLSSGTCTFTKNGYRLPTEAEWEYAARGGNTTTYLNYCNGNSIVTQSTNLPDSKDPYETGSYPHTTPVGFYDGSLKNKTDYNWPGAATSYQTISGKNGFGLYDMQGNVWEFVNDWYSQNYYSSSPYDNPKGPASGFIMPDGKPYRGMRGGNWYNGLVVGGINDGHSRVSNRNPSYYRGPQDPNHPYYHLGFRIARNSNGQTTGIGTWKPSSTPTIGLMVFPNPSSGETTIRFSLDHPAKVTIVVSDALGREFEIQKDQFMDRGLQTIAWNRNSLPPGIYTCQVRMQGSRWTTRMTLIN